MNDIDTISGAASVAGAQQPAAAVPAAREHIIARVIAALENIPSEIAHDFDAVVAHAKAAI